MTYDEYVTDHERKVARWLAIGMHVAIVVLFVFGVAWQKRYTEPAAIVDLWTGFTPPRQEAPVPPPKPMPKAEPKPEPRPAPPPPKPDVKPIPKADIALKEKLEKERKVKEQQEMEKKKLLELEKRKEDEAKKKKAQQLEAKKKEEKLEQERLAQEKRAAQEKSEIAARLAKEQQASQRALFDKYITLIQNQVRRHIVEPPNLQGNPQVEFQVVLIPGGEVLNVQKTRSSGVPAYDDAVERAIRKASPLPLPPDPTLFQQFRELNLKIRPRE